MSATSECPEERLEGGRLSYVVRVGDTVRRAAQPWSGEVQRLLAHVRSRGFTLAPEPLGFDDGGREVVRYVEGDTLATVKPWPGSVWSDELLVDVGRAVATYHRAVADFVPSPGARWQYRPRVLEPGEVICHHDFAPYNAVFHGGRLLGVLDWEGAGPGTVREELAFLAWQWAPLHPPTREVGSDASPEGIDPGARLRRLLDSYGYDEREGFVDAVIDRVEISRSGIESSAAAGSPAHRRLLEEGHTRDMARLIAHLDRIRPALQARIE